MFYQAVTIKLCQQGCVLKSVVHSFARCQTLDLRKDTHIFDLDKINAFFSAYNVATACSLACFCAGKCDFWDRCLDKRQYNYYICDNYQNFI